MLRKKKDNSDYEIDRELTWKFAIEKNAELRYKFCLVKTKLNNEIETNNFDNLANSFLFNKSNLISDMIFISGKSKLLEKRLGEGESMVLLAKSLIGFEGSISFRQVKDKNGKNRIKYLNIKDINFSKDNKESPISSNRKHKKGSLTLMHNNLK